jgi:hypothetical protein
MLATTSLIARTDEGVAPQSWGPLDNSFRGVVTGWSTPSQAKQQPLPLERRSKASQHTGLQNGTEGREQSVGMPKNMAFMSIRYVPSRSVRCKA